MHVSIESPEVTSSRLHDVLRTASLEWMNESFAFVEYPVEQFPAHEAEDAVAMVRDGSVWSVLRPAVPDAKEVVALFRIHFKADLDNSGFVGWLASLLKMRLGTGVFVVCGQNSSRGGIFDYWGIPIDQLDPARAVLADLRLELPDPKRSPGTQ